MLLVLLQNGWSGYYTRIGMPGEVPERRAERVWIREHWIEATWCCPSGRKLTKILEGVDDDYVWLDDTTLEIADKPSGVCKANPAHVRSVLETRGITEVLACGNQAGTVIDKLWRGPLVKIPHPACRVLTNTTLLDYRAYATQMVHDYHPEVCRVQLSTRGIVTKLPGHNEALDVKDWIIPDTPAETRTVFCPPGRLP